jgi:hypothetical protein
MIVALQCHYEPAPILVRFDVTQPNLLLERAFTVVQFLWFRSELMTDAVIHLPVAFLLVQVILRAYQP